MCRRLAVGSLGPMEMLESSAHLATGLVRCENVRADVVAWQWHCTFRSGADGAAPHSRQTLVARCLAAQAASRIIEDNATSWTYPSHCEYLSPLLLKICMAPDR